MHRKTQNNLIDIACKIVNQCTTCSETEDNGKALTRTTEHHTAEIYQDLRDCASRAAEILHKVCKAKERCVFQKA